MRDIIVVGAGRVGLANARYLAMTNKEDHVIVYDQDSNVINLLTEGSTPFGKKFLPDLDSLAIDYWDVLPTDLGNDTYVVICVGVGVNWELAQNEGDGYQNFKDTPLGKTLDAIIEKYPNLKLVVFRGTIQPEWIQSIKAEYKRHHAFVSFPEFLVEGEEEHGAVKQDSEQNFIGLFTEDNDIALNRTLELFWPSHGSIKNAKKKALSKITRCSAAEAMAAKIWTNIGLAMRVTLANLIADHVGEKSARKVAEMVGSDPRIGRRYLKHGPGYGGSCLPFAMRLYPMEVIDSADHYNYTTPERLMNRLGDKVLFFGFNFKGSGVMDIRESQQLKMISLAKHQCSEVWVSDDKPHDIIRGLYVEDPTEILKEVDSIVIFYDTKFLRRLKPGIFQGIKHKVIYDFR